MVYEKLKGVNMVEQIATQASGINWTVLCIVIGWLAFFIFNWGYSFAYWQREYDKIADEMHVADLLFSILFLGLLGPCAIVQMLILMRPFHGFKWW
jgi:hypothetical protein